MSQQLRRLHILLVDNDPNVREKVQQALSSGCTLRSARTLDEARRDLETHTPDVLISEIILPHGSGLDLCRLVRHSPTLNILPVMLLTTLSTLQDKVAGFDAGADDYVVKPFDGRHLMARIRLLSRIKRLEYDRD